MVFWSLCGVCGCWHTMVRWTPLSVFWTALFVWFLCWTAWHSPKVVSFKTYIIFFTLCFGKSTSVLVTLLIPALGSPPSNRICRCAGIVWQNECQVANRVTDVSGESIIHGITSEVSRQRAGFVCALVNIKWFDFNKRGCFLFCNVDLAYLSCRLHHPPYLPWRRSSLER
jgi:hypothetical protein